eukprot:TRINITY_DN1314_c0_g1_i1.p1 TRINITY_DN1314_c0_g1~~TRINITY_DN1314_c0_g1_i1.p1  ORF type:complete len:142 (+),score=27.25 TRINITY_DN1314_c0_g1_i1:58-483(+)
MHYCLLLAFLLCLGTLGSEAQNKIQGAASSNNIRDCFCQCSRLTFKDKRSLINGNCKTTFNGAQWCYVTKKAAKNGDCPDAIPSRRFPGRMWSHFSCTTTETRACVFDAVNSGGCSLGLSSNKRVNALSSPTASSSDPNAP